MCCGGRQVQTLLQLARLLKVRIERRDFPNAQAMREMRMKTQMHKIEETIAQGRFDYMELTEELVKRGNSEQLIAAAALQLYFGIPKKRWKSRLSRGNAQRRRTPRICPAATEN